jgi:hypothetical protein
MANVRVGDDPLDGSQLNGYFPVTPFSCRYRKLRNFWVADESSIWICKRCAVREDLSVTAAHVNVGRFLSK